MKRYPSLDALRGLAALVVVLNHLAFTIPDARAKLRATMLLAPLVSGPSAVYVFFVLSGFVLFLTLEGKDGGRYAPFIVKRIGRSYPPVAVAVLLSAAMYAAVGYHPIGALTSWFNLESWSRPLTPGLVLGNLALLDGARFTNLDNAIWSLSPELRISLILPLIAIAVRWRWAVTLVASFLLSVACRRIANAHGDLGLAVNPFSTLQYVFLFTAGAVLAYRVAALRRTMGAGAGRWIGWIALPIAIALTSVEPDTRGGLLTDAGAIALVALCVGHAPFERLLSHRALSWLGRISYSLYLTHIPVLLLVFHLLFGRLGMAGTLLLTVPLIFVVAEAFNRIVERPSMRLGRWAGSKMMLRRGFTPHAAAGPLRSG